MALLKPRVMSLVVFTAFVGLLLAPGGINPFIGAVAILCIAVGAGASGALNMWYDSDIDAVMSRTANRPIRSGPPTVPAAPRSTAHSPDNHTARKFMEIKELGHVVLYVRDITRSAHFYGEVLGVNQSMSALARILGPALGSFLFFADSSHVLPYAVGAALMAVVLAVTLRLRPE